MKQIVYSVGVVAILFLLAYIAMTITGTRPNVNRENTTREVFIQNCIDEATSGQGAAPIGQATAVCTCFYDEGVNRFGETQFIEEATELERTGELSREFQILVSDCSS